MVRLPARLIALLAALGCAAATSAEAPRPLRLDDLQSMEAFQGHMPRDWSIARDGALAMGIARATKTRSDWRASANDVWVQLAPGQPLARITEGASDDTTWENPLWSPDGNRLVLMSNRGGSRTLWVWERATRALQQLSPRVLEWDEGFFEWVDDNRVLCSVLPEGVVSKEIAPGNVPPEMQPALKGWSTYAAGRETSASVLESGVPPDESSLGAQGSRRDLLLIDVSRKTTQLLLESYQPSEYYIRLFVNPTGRFVAVGRHAAPVVSKGLDAGGTLTIEILGLDGKPAKLERELPPDVLWQTPRWSPDGTQLAFFAHGTSRDDRPRLVRANISTGRVEERAVDPVVVGQWRDSDWDVARLEWTERGEIVFRGALEENAAKRGARRDWWLAPRKGPVRQLTADMKSVPDFMRLSRNGPLIGLIDGRLWRIDAARGAVLPLDIKGAPPIAAIVWPMSINAKMKHFGRNYVIEREERLDQGAFIVSATDPATQAKTHYWVDAKGEAVLIAMPEPGAAPVRMDESTRTVFWLRDDGGVARLWRSDIAGRTSDRLAELNPWFASVAEPPEMFIDYTSLAGAPLKGWLRLPFGYEKGKQYPLIVSVYPGQKATNRPKYSDASRLYWDSFRLEATAGYATLVPTMPGDCCSVRKDGERYDVYFDVPDGVLPAIEKAIELGIADPDRLFVEGASMGGFASFALITQTRRFKAATAHAGISNWTSSFGTFSCSGRYGEDIPQLMIGWAADNLQPRPGAETPWSDLGLYQRNSPITYVERVHTPVLLIHNDMDCTEPMMQSEEFFSALQRQGKRAQFVRYWGEGHGTDSPANRRDRLQRRLAWYDEFGDISRDAKGNMIFEGDRVKSRSGAMALKPADFVGFDLFGPGGEEGTKQRVAERAAGQGDR